MSSLTAATGFVILVLASTAVLCSAARFSDVETTMISLHSRTTSHACPQGKPDEGRWKMLPCDFMPKDTYDIIDMTIDDAIFIAMSEMKDLRYGNVRTVFAKVAGTRLQTDRCCSIQVRKRNRFGVLEWLTLPGICCYDECPKWVSPRCDDTTYYG